jgi:hypothetical protein
MGEGRKLYGVLVGKAEGRRPLERPRRRWDDGIKMDLRETGWGCVEWIHLDQDRDCWWAVVNAVMNLRVLVPHSFSCRGCNVCLLGSNEVWVGVEVLEEHRVSTFRDEDCHL